MFFSSSLLNENIYSNSKSLLELYETKPNDFKSYLIRFKAFHMFHNYWNRAKWLCGTLTFQFVYCRTCCTADFTKVSYYTGVKCKRVAQYAVDKTNSLCNCSIIIQTVFYNAVVLPVLRHITQCMVLEMAYTFHLLSVRWFYYYAFCLHFLCNFEAKWRKPASVHKSLRRTVFIWLIINFDGKEINSLKNLLQFFSYYTTIDRDVFYSNLNQLALWRIVRLHFPLCGKRYIGLSTDYLSHFQLSA